SDAATAGHQGTDAWVLWWHRWLGVPTAGVAATAAILAVALAHAGRGAGACDPDSSSLRRGRRPFAWYRLTVVLSAVLVGATGHFGGMLIYGPDYLQESWAKAWPGPPRTTVTLARAGAPIDFTREVQPIFARRCYQCHAGGKVE